jgi:hypothetical protein
MVQSVLLPGVRVPSAPAPADGPKARRKHQACQLLASKHGKWELHVTCSGYGRVLLSWHIGRSLVRPVMPATEEKRRTLQQ